MPVTKVPEHFLAECDCCGTKEQTTSNIRPPKWGHLHLQRDAVDMHGKAAADGSVKFLFCPNCLYAVEKAINKKVDELRHPDKSA